MLSSGSRLPADSSLNDVLNLIDGPVPDNPWLDCFLATPHTYAWWLNAGQSLGSVSALWGGQNLATACRSPVVTSLRWHECRFLFSLVKIVYFVESNTSDNWLIDLAVIGCELSCNLSVWCFRELFLSQIKCEFCVSFELGMGKRRSQGGSSAAGTPKLQFKSPSPEWIHQIETWLPGRNVSLRIYVKHMK